MIGLEDLTKAIHEGVNSNAMQSHLGSMMEILAKVYEKGFCDAIDIVTKSKKGL